MKDEQESVARARFAAERRDPATVDPGLLDPVPFDYAGRSIGIVIETEEFTHICPMTGLPDFGHIRIEYEPDALIVELKSLKYYLTQYRNVGIFYEHVVLHVLDHLVAATRPRRMRIDYTVRPRGGIGSTVSASYPQD
ncbi:MAG: NADPH-dependent 7-cyano-7-deazaguanine reductase QueF [Ectothiorhodospiraceae bacterium]|nr:NADPH-dependent 7-cyano-7-deazaguanine reductase QueF [Chromatiales bacterium]MCP5156007.1 NADPH-dependent 7-cyano-7-deazaguanine reductase QueF [Ectothiorhodospiraceae bacterium]